MGAIMFDPGRILMTPGAMEAIKAAKQMPGPYLTRHCEGDWGDVDAGDKRLNNVDFKCGRRMLSAYTLADGETIWIITDAIDMDVKGADHRVRVTTTVLLPSEY